MKITIEVSDKEEFISALNNSLIALNDIANTFFFCCDPPHKWIKWQEKNKMTNDECCEILRNRISLLKDVMLQIEDENYKKDVVETRIEYHI